MAARNPILAVWDAINILNEVEKECCHMNIERLLGQAEAALIDLVIALRENVDRSPPANLIRLTRRRSGDSEFVT